MEERNITFDSSPELAVSSFRLKNYMTFLCCFWHEQALCYRVIGRTSERRTVLSDRKARKPKPVANAIESAIGAIGLSTSYHGWTVVQRWPELVGENIAKHAKAYRYDDGTLYVAVKDASWRQNLAMDTETILQKIRSFPFGRSIKHIRLVASERG